MLDRDEHPTMPLNYCNLVWLAFKQPGGRIMLSLQFKFLALKGHISTACAMKDHIIRVTYLATCPFGLLDACTYSLYRDVFFFLGFFSHSFLKAIQLLHILCTPSLLLCTPSLSSMILPLPLLSASSSEVLPGQSLFLSHCFVIVSRLVFLCVSMCWIASFLGIVFLLYLLCLILNVSGYYCVFVQISGVEIILGFWRTLSLLCLDSTRQLGFSPFGFVSYFVWGTRNLLASFVGQGFTVLTSLHFFNTRVQTTLFHLSWIEEESFP